MRGIEIIRHLLPDLPTKYAMPVAYRWEGPSPGNIDVAQMLAAAYLDSLNEQLQESQRRMHEQDQSVLDPIIAQHEAWARYLRRQDDGQTQRQQDEADLRVRETEGTGQGDVPPLR